MHRARKRTRTRLFIAQLPTRFDIFVVFPIFFHTFSVVGRKKVIF